LSIVITVRDQGVPWAVVQHIIVKFLTNENMKPAEILTTQSSSVMKPSHGSRCMTGVSHLKARQRVKTCKDNTFCRVSYGQCFLGFSRHLIIQSFLKYKKSKLFTQNFKADLSKSSPPWQCTSAHCFCDNRNTGGNALGSTATPHLYSWPGTKRFTPVWSTERNPRRKNI